jgi:methylase of polypeptide subunit release factors
MNLDFSASSLDAILGASLFDHFLQPEPMSGCLLEPELLLRHASGRLYQEAHLHLEKEIRQHYLPGFAPDTPTKGILMKDVRFTPPSLARVIVEQALDTIREQLTPEASIEILDPACGSGIFLQETIRELALRSYQGSVTLRGFDTSRISCEIARFCLNLARQDFPLQRITIDIKQQDSLQCDWGKPDIILMNPPFVPWERMAESSQEIVRETLGGLTKYRADMAMAFIWKAAQALSEKAVLATVLPSPLFETQSGESWRRALATAGELILLGRFEGYGFFRGSIVEPGILVLRGRTSEGKRRQNEVRIVIAKSGHEDEAIRGLRKQTERSLSPSEWDVFPIGSAVLTSASWMPRFRGIMQRIEMLTEKHLPTVEDLFSVHQGTRTGHNKAFVLSLEELDSLPKKERGYFRPIASNSTIHDGIIGRTEFVFFPYDGSGPVINTEEELRRQMPRYAERWLSQHETKLKSRENGDPARWWLLDRPRSWQYSNHSKLVSTYFGDRGSFAFDQEGDTVVLQGHGWFWKKKPRQRRDFVHSPLPWAYLALLNSGVFEDLLEGACPRIQGGQFNLSTRFVNRVFLPDLSDDMQVAGEIVEELAEIGRGIQTGIWPNAEDINQFVIRAYGLPH